MLIAIILHISIFNNDILFCGNQLIENILVSILLSCNLYAIDNKCMLKFEMKKHRFNEKPHVESFYIIIHLELYKNGCKKSQY